MLDKIKAIIKYLNEKGFPIPLLKDNTQYPSVSLTLLWISSVFVILSILAPVTGFKVSFWESLSWHITSAVLYYNRNAKISKDGIEISANAESNKQEKE